MADQTPIEWTDATWNIITGCSVVSPGCTNCYAMKWAGGRLKNIPSRKGLTVASKAGPVWNGQVRFNTEWLTDPLRWTRPRMIFVCAHGDLFHEGVPDEWLDQIFAVMALCPQHTFQVLTKRPERMRAYLADPIRRKAALDAVEVVKPLKLYDGFGQRSVCLADQRRTREKWMRARESLSGCFLPNVWLGVSVEDQARADERIPVLLDTPAAVRWISAEPLLGPVDLQVAWHGENALDSECWGDCGWCKAGHPPLHNCQRGKGDWEKWRSGLDWVVAGGESGPGARPMHPDWARQLRDQCAEAGVPFLFKQWGSWAPTGNTVELAGGSGAPYVAWPDGTIAHGHAHEHGGPGLILREAGKKAAGRHLDGQLHDGFPVAP